MKIYSIEELIELGKKPQEEIIKYKKNIDNTFISLIAESALEAIKNGYDLSKFICNVRLNSIKPNCCLCLFSEINLCGKAELRIERYNKAISLYKLLKDPQLELEF